MRKGILFIYIILTAFALKAQFSVGVRGGIGDHGIAFDPTDLMQYQTSFYQPNAGLVIIYNNDNNAGLQTEINYTQKGWHEEDTTLDNSYFKRQINYLEVPFYSHWEIGYGKVRPIIFAGPYFGWKLGETTDSSNFSHIWNSDNPYLQYEQDTRDLDFGIKLGLGLRYNITSKFGVYFDIKYDFQVAGGRDIFIDRPNNIRASRLSELGGSFGILYHIIPQKKKKVVDGYTPKENLLEEY